jgi:hypothetical protein
MSAGSAYDDLLAVVEFVKLGMCCLAKELSTFGGTLQNGVD